MGDLIGSSEYGSVRLVLGLASDDTTTVPDATLADSLFLGAVERHVKRVVTAWSTILAGGGDRAQALKDGTVMLLAARVAELSLARKDAAEIKSQSLGPASVTFRDGAAWSDMARSLVGDAAKELAFAITGGATTGLPYIKRSGPTRAQRLSEAGANRQYWLDILTPPMIRKEVP